MFRTTALLGVVGVGGAAAVAAGAAVSSAEAAAADKPKIVDLVALRKDYDETAVPAREEMIHNMRVTKVGALCTGPGLFSGMCALTEAWRVDSGRAPSRKKKRA